MAAKDLGTKYTCFKCGAKFYDLKKPEPICPKCGADQRESPALRAPEKGERKRRAAAAVVEEPAIEEESTDEEPAADEEDEAEEIPEDNDDDF
ncbi:MAG: TIGR02300 family protein [Myxococcales bacterium]